MRIINPINNSVTKGYMHEHSPPAPQNTMTIPTRKYMLSDLIVLARIGFDPRSALCIM